MRSKEKGNKTKRNTKHGALGKIVSLALVITLIVSMFSGMAIAASGTATATIQPGDVSAIKDANWTSYSAREATITFDFKGEPIPTDSDIILVVDRSGTMFQDKHKVNGKTRWEYARDAAVELVDALLPAGTGNRVAYVPFYTKTDGSINFTQDPKAITEPIKNQIIYTSDYHIHNGTSIGDGYEGATNYVVALQKAIEFAQNRNSTKPLHVIFISDGAPTQTITGNSMSGIDQATSLINTYGATIHTIGVPGSSLPALQRIISPGLSPIMVNDISNLDEVLKRIGKEVTILATNAVLTDTISEYFYLDTDKNIEIVEVDEHGKETSILGNGETIKISNGSTSETIEGGDIPDSFKATEKPIITVNLGNLTKTTKRVKIPVVLKNSYASVTDNYPTNHGDATLDYSKPSGGTDTKAMVSPILPVGSGLIEVRYYRVSPTKDPSGNYIYLKADGTQAVGKDDALLHKNDMANLITGKSYPINADLASNPIFTNYKAFTPSSKTVTLATDGQKETVEFFLYQDQLTIEAEGITTNYNGQPQELLKEVNGKKFVIKFNGAEVTANNVTISVDKASGSTYPSTATTGPAETNVSRDASDNVIPYEITITATYNGMTTTKTVYSTINPLPVTLQVNNQQKQATHSEPGLSADYIKSTAVQNAIANSGVDLQGTPTLARQSGETANVNYPIYATNLANLNKQNPNYVITENRGIFTITPAPVVPTPPPTTPPTVPTPPPTTPVIPIPTPTPTPTPTPAPATPPTTPPTPPTTPVTPPTTPATPPTTPVAPASVTPSETEQQDDDFLTSLIGDTGVPFAANGLFNAAAWSLFDLLMTLLTLVGIVVYAIRTGRKVKNERELEYEQYSTNPNAQTEQDDEQQDEKGKKRKLVMLGVALAFVFNLLLFILTQDMRLPMIFFDRYSIIFAAVAVIQIVMQFFRKKKKSDDDQSEQQDDGRLIYKKA